MDAKLIIIVGCLLAARLAPAAGYDTNVWPSWIAYKADRTQMQQLYEAVTERVDMAEESYSGPSLSYPAAPAWWKFQRANLMQIKTTLKQIIPHFVAPTNSVLLGTNTYATWMNTNSWYYENEATHAHPYLPHYTIEAACIDAGVPTNALDYTPWKMLDQAGRFTDDAGYVAHFGHYHGYSNAHTAVGGTNFPGTNVTTWYTTDYGLETCRKIADLLYLTERDTRSPNGRNVPAADVRLGKARFAYGTDPAAVGASYDADTPDDADVIGTIGTYTIVDEVTAGSAEYKMRGRWAALTVFKDALTNDASCTAYALCSVLTTNGVTDYGSTFINVFDANGDGYVYGWQVVEEFSFPGFAPTNAAGKAYSTNAWYEGHSPMATRPAWSGAYGYRGYTILDIAVMMEWERKYKIE